MAAKKLPRMEKLPEQDLQDVLAEFYRLKSMIKKDIDEHQKNYVVIRLVTIIEQFFRCIVEIQLKNGTIPAPETVTLGTHIIDEIASSVSRLPKKTIRNRIISLTYSFQNIKAITSVSGAAIKSISKKNSLDKLFKHRHNLIHSVDRPVLSFHEIRQCCDVTEGLLRRVLDNQKNAELSFQIVKGQSLQKLGDIDGSKKCYANALNQFENSAKSDPDNPNLHFGIGLAHLQLEDHDLALKSFSDAARLKPDIDEVNLYKALLLFRLERYAEAVQSCMAEIKVDPNSMFAFRIAGVALSAIGEMEMSLACMDRAIFHEPANVFAYREKARILKAHGLQAWADNCNMQSPLHMPSSKRKHIDTLAEQSKQESQSSNKTNVDNDDSNVNHDTVVRQVVHTQS